MPLTGVITRPAQVADGRGAAVERSCDERRHATSEMSARSAGGGKRCSIDTRPCRGERTAALGAGLALAA